MLLGFVEVLVVTENISYQSTGTNARGRAMCMRYTEYSDGVHGCMRSGARDARDHVHSGACRAIM